VRTAHNTTDYLKKDDVDFIKPDMWPQTGLILNSNGLRCGAFSNESITEESLTRWKN